MQLKNSMDENNSSEIYVNNINYNIKVFELNDNNNTISNLLNGTDKKKVARKRWAILAKALKSPTGTEPSSPTHEVSLRKISSFMLLKTEPTTILTQNSNDLRIQNQIEKRTWYKYYLNIDNIEYNVNVGHRKRTFSAEDLMGFNNTGNVCIWPSEETLTYYCCTNLCLFSGKSVLELGGGMSCLAGLFIAKYANARHVTLTDGNKLSIENVLATLNCNNIQCPIEAFVLKWNTKLQLQPTQFDIVLCADCLFFDDARNDLIECLWNCLSLNGLALIMAPERGRTLDCFIKQSQQRGFKCDRIMNYNGIVWEKRMKLLLENCDYNDNIHYPILIKLTKI